MKGRDAGGLTPADAEKIFYSFSNTHHRAAFRLMTNEGLSPEEILGDEGLGLPGIYIQDVNSKEMTVFVKSRFVKDDIISERTIPISTESLMAVKDLLFSQGFNLTDKGPLFDMTARRLRQVLAESNITPLMCRQLAIIKMLRTGLAPDEVRRRLGFIRPREEIYLSIAGVFLLEPDNFNQAVADMVWDSVLKKG